MPKRTSTGLVKYTTRTVTKRGRKNYGKRTVKRKGRKMQMGYTFSRWITALTGTNVTNCTYDTGTSIIALNVPSTPVNSTCAFSTTFALADLPNVSEFSSLFDDFMITGCKVQIKMIDNPDSNSTLNAGAASQQNNFYPTIWYVTDLDDSNNVTLAQIKEFQGVRHRVLKPNQELNIMVRPRTLTQVYRSSLSTSYATNKKQWIDMTATDTPHYALKTVIDFEGLIPNLSYRFKVNVRYFFKCKHVR